MSATTSTDALDPVRWIDPRTLHDLVSEACGPGVAPLSVRADYLRAKPGRSALLGLTLRWNADTETRASLYLGDGAALAADKAMTLRLVAPALGPTLVYLERHAALLLALPNDRALRGLSAAADPRRLGNRLARLGPWDGSRVSARRSRITAMRWKPGRRAVLRAELVLVDDASGTLAERTAWLRVWPVSELPMRLAGWRAAAAIPALGSPALEAIDRERGFAVIEHVAGSPWAVDLARLVAPLRALHAQQPCLHMRTDLDDLRAARTTLTALSGFLPEVAARAVRLGDELARAFAALAPIDPAFLHGDLGADQLIEGAGRVRLLDFDEAALGDPHADFASLAADLAARGAARDADVGSLAREVLGSRWSLARWHAQRAAAHARRALAALQCARADWAGDARDSLARAESALGSPPVVRPFRRSTPAETLAPILRHALPGVDGRTLSVTAVWPEEAGLIARLDAVEAPGVPALWVQWGPLGPEAHAFPADPALPAMATFLGAGFAFAGHRFGKRAALRAPDGRYLYLRPAGRVADAFARVREADVHLQVAGVLRAGGLRFAPEHDGWWSDAASGGVRAAAGLAPTHWESLGRQLARVHRTVTATPLDSRGVSRASSSAERQVAARRMFGGDDAGEHERRLERWRPSALSAGTPAWIHGDLHPGQFVTGDDVTVIDWERARDGEAEEDLGNLAAHLAWELGDRAALAWRSVTRGYAASGGRYAAEPWLAYARLALVRVLAIWSWRDAGRERTRDASRWDAVMEELASW